MDINKLNHVTEVTQVPDTSQNVQGDGSFKFTLASAITDADLQAKVDMLLSDITAQGNRIAQHMDIRDMKKYRGLIREFMNEVVFRSHKFSRENFLDRRGRQRNGAGYQCGPDCRPDYFSRLFRLSYQSGQRPESDFCHTAECV